MKELIITSSTLIIFITIMRFVLKGRISLRLQYALWALVLIRLALPFPISESNMSVMNAVVPLMDQTIQSYTDEPRNYAPGVNAIETFGPNTGDDPNINSVNAGNAPTISMSPTGMTLLKIIWLSGTIIMALAFVISNIGFYMKLRMVRRPVKIDGFRHNVYVANMIETPCMFGLIKPSIYLTPDVYEDSVKLRHVLTHEETHILHGDSWWSLIRGICLAVYWYNPLVWLAALLSRSDAELACDEGAIMRLGEENRLAYGRTLVELTVQKSSAKNLLCCATTIAYGKKRIKERIMLIAQKPNMMAVTLLATLIVIAAVIGCTFTGMITDKTDYEQMAVERFQSAEEAYSWFTDYSEIETDDHDIIESEYGSYARVAREGIDSLYSLREYLSQYFDEDICGELINTNDTVKPLFKEFDGVLYRLVEDNAMLKYSAGKRDFSVEYEKEEKSLRLLLNYEALIIDEEAPEYVSPVYTMVQGKDDIWRFTGRFPLPIEYAYNMFNSRTKQNYQAVESLDNIDVPHEVFKAAKELVERHYEMDRADFPQYKYVNWRIDSLSWDHTYETNDMLADIYHIRYRFLSMGEKAVLSENGLGSEPGSNWVWPLYFNESYLIFDRVQNKYFLTVLESDPQLGSFYPLDDELRARLDNIYVDPLAYGLATEYPFNEETADLWGYITGLTENAVFVDEVTMRFDERIESSGYEIIDDSDIVIEFKLAQDCEFWILDDYVYPMLRLDFDRFLSFCESEADNSWFNLWFFHINDEGEIVQIAMKYQV